MDANEYIGKNTRSFNPGKVKTSESRGLRFKDEVVLIDKHTIQFATGKVKDNNFLTLQDVKNFLAQQEKHNLDPKSEMAQVHDDMVKLCVRGINIDGKKIRLTAKTVGTNRVAYFNMQLIRDLIAAEKANAKKTALQGRLNVINNLPDRPGYQPK